MKKIIFWLLVLWSGLFADGFLIGIPERMMPNIIPQALSVKYHRVNVQISNGIAQTKIDQVFKNDTDYDLEGTYIFPLPEDAAINNFSMYMNGQKVSGQILDKDEAKKIYEDIVRKMQDPGLLEYAGRNMFKARVYPVPKHGEVRIELSYQQTISYDSGVYKYVYPLNTEKYSPKDLEEVMIAVNIDSPQPIKTVYSPSHPIQPKINQKQASCSYEEKNIKPNKDFILYYTVSEKDIGLNLINYPINNNSGYFMLMLSPGQIESQAQPKDIVFVLDSSGSMSGQKIEQAKDALIFCLNSLSAKDRFNVINFADNENKYQDGLVEATPKNIQNALKFVKNISAGGGTNINDTMISALKIFNNQTRPRMLVFLTDGEPTVGITDLGQIISNIAAANTSKTRVFVFGVGTDVNTHLLDKISADQRGVSDYILPEENIETKVSSFYRKISAPVLADIKLDFGQIKVNDIFPKTLPDLFKGSQTIILGRYEGNGTATITLSGYMNGVLKKISYTANFQSSSKEHDFIPRIWATRKIGYLTSEIRLHGEKKELVDEIIRLSKEFGIMTTYTSFLVLEKEKDYTDWGIKRSAAPAIQTSGAEYKVAMDSQSGSGSVAKAKDIQYQQKNEQIEEATMDTIKYVGAKTFYLRDEVWTDSTYTKQIKVKKIKYLSSEYFDLLNNRPEISKYLAIGKQVIVVIDKLAYQVN